jgi:TonB-linked SusC/RagA family outer membrane protein
MHYTSWKFTRAALTFAVVGVLLALTAGAAAAQRVGTIRGIVRQAGLQRPIAGVQISVEGTRLGAITDAEGRFEIANVPEGSARVRVRMIGYTTQLIETGVSATQPATLEVNMRESVIALDAVVVTGTGAAVEKKQLGNTIATVDMSRIETAPVQTFSEVLSGREPGVDLMASSGMAGAGARIRIRGSSSLSMSNEPVVYVDGVRIDNGGSFVNNGQNAAEPSRLDDISPESIERVEILKGAAAATLYGSEASGGVIQIFTKRGSQGAPRFSFRVEQGISRYPGDVYKPNAGFARTQGQADTINQLHGNTPGWTDVGPYDVFERNFVTDLFETGRQQVYSASVSGGGEQVNYFVSARFARDDGPMKQDRGPAQDVNRKIQSSATITIFPRQRLSFRIGSLFTDTKHQLQQNGNNIYGVVSLGMFGKPEQGWCDDIDGDGQMDVSSETYGTSIPVCEGTGNPTGQAAFMTPREALQQEAQMDTEHFNGNLTASYQATQDVDIEATFGLDVTNSREFEFGQFGYGVDGFTGRFTDGFRDIGSRNHRELTLDLKGNWSTRVGNFSSQFTAGAQGFISTDNRAFSDGRDFPGPGLEVVEAAANQTAFEEWLQVVNTGLYAQEQVGFNDYAYLTVGGRWDKNSAFGKNTGGAFYPKISMSIIPSDMPGWTSTTLSTFRVRGALGRSGLQPGAFSKLTTYGAGSTTEGAGLIPENLGNEDLAPERSQEWEVGAELGLFNNTVGLEATYWNRKTSDALVARQFPLAGGFAAFQLDNIGELQGQGLELKFDWLALDRENLSVTVFATGSYLKERILSMGTAPPIKIGGSYSRPRHFLKGPEDWDADGDLDYFAPGAFFGAALPDYTWTPGSTSGTVPFDTDGDGDMDDYSELVAYLTGNASVDLSSSAMSPLMRDDDGDGDFWDTYLGKPVPDWAGAFGGTLTLWQNLDITPMFEFKTGNFTVQNLTDGFRKSNNTIGRNTPQAAQVEATLADPDTQNDVDARVDAAMTWATWLKGLSPHAGMNMMENARFLRWRELSVTYRAPAAFAERLGLNNLVFAFSGRNLYKWDSYTGIDQEMNDISRCTSSDTQTNTDCNFSQSMDAFGLPLPRRYTVSVQFGF